MIKTTAILVEELTQYSSPADKISRLVKEKKIFPIIKGLYETDKSTSGYLLSESIYGPSYLSFEYALSFYGLIPEAVYTFTSATFEKKKKKIYKTPFGIFSYRDVPSKVYSYGVNIIKENNYWYKLATVEKAICDQLYKTKTVSNYNELEKLLFEDLRIDEVLLNDLNKDDIYELASKYGSVNVQKFSSWLRRNKK